MEDIYNLNNDADFEKYRDYDDNYDDYNDDEYDDCDGIDDDDLGYCDGHYLNDLEHDCLDYMECSECPYFRRYSDDD